MPTALPAAPSDGENRRAALTRLRIAIVRAQAHCRSAAATIAELRSAVSGAIGEAAAPRGMLIRRVNHDMAAVARTSAEGDALRSLASPARLLDMETNARSRGRLERELEDIAASAGDLRVVRRSESITVVGPDGASVRVNALAAALESTTAELRLVDPRPAEPKRTTGARRRPRISVRLALRVLASAVLGRRLAAGGA